jgi:hypothetical protein
VTGDRRLAARALIALALANARYWSTVAPVVRKQLRHWESRARTIPDPELRGLAVQKLHAEGFNAEAAAMLATLAPHAHRRHAVQAIVALELLFDYLDGLTERPIEDPLGEGERLFAPFMDAIYPSSPPAAPDRDGAPHPQAADSPHPQGADGYLQELSSAVRVALEQLPAISEVLPIARRAAERSARAQIRMHASRSIGTAQLESWAGGEAQGTDLGWREYLAGAASSVLAVHALIAAAADPNTTPTEAQEIDDTYLSICVVVTLLDGLVDHAHDSSAGESSYFSLYDNDDLLAQALARVAERALRQAQALQNGAHHVITLTGAVAYYASTPGANSDLARPVMAQLTEALGPLVSPPLLMTRTWRAAKRTRLRWRRTSVSTGLDT